LVLGFLVLAECGSEVTERYGRIGSEGQKNTKGFAAAAAPAKHADKLIAE
jgi:predicted DNA-binding WGR domain protein